MHRDAAQIAAAPEPGRCTPMLQMCELRAKSGQSRIASREALVKEPGHAEQVRHGDLFSENVILTRYFNKKIRSKSVLFQTLRF